MENNPGLDVIFPDIPGKTWAHGRPVLVNTPGNLPCLETKTPSEITKISCPMTGIDSYHLPLSMHRYTEGVISISNYQSREKCLFIALFTWQKP